MKVLFVTWDSGAVDYLASLFFPTFAALKERGIEVHTLQGTWGDDASVQRVQEHAERLGLRYVAVRCPAEHRRVRMPWTLLRLAREVARYARRQQMDVVMPRAMIPAAVTSLAKPLLLQQRIVWDADGLPADERVDFAGWSRRGLPYRAMRGVEARMLRWADATMVRTERAAEILRQRAGAHGNSLRIEVVPNGRDPNVYAPSAELRTRIRAREQIAPHAPVLLSVGSLGPQYYPDVQADIAAALLARDSDAHAVFLTAQSDQIQRMLRARGADMSRVIAQRVPATAVPEWLVAADVGLALRQSSFSQRAVCPLKVGEYLLSGLPVIATTGVGDLDTQLAGVPSLLLDDPHIADVQTVVEWIAQRIPLKDDVRTHCRKTGIAHFSLAAAVNGYDRILQP